VKIISILRHLLYIYAADANSFSYDNNKMFKLISVKIFYLMAIKSPRL